MPSDCEVLELLVVAETDMIHLLDTRLGDDVLVAGLTVVVLVLLRVAIGEVGGASVVVAITGVCTSAKVHFFQLLFFFSQQSHNDGIHSIYIGYR